MAIAAGANHITALRHDGTVMVLGQTVEASFSNYVPANLSNLVAIAASGDRDLGLFGTHAPAITVQPWGSDDCGYGHQCLVSPNAPVCSRCGISGRSME